MNESRIKIYVNDYSHVVSASSSEWARCIQRYFNDHYITATSVDVYITAKGNTGVSKIFVDRDLTHFAKDTSVQIIELEPSLIRELRDNHETRYGCPGVRFFKDADTYYVICDATGHDRRNYSAF